MVTKAGSLAGKEGDSLFREHVSCAPHVAVHAISTFPGTGLSVKRPIQTSIPTTKDHTRLRYSTHNLHTKKPSFLPAELRMRGIENQQTDKNSH